MSCGTMPVAAFVRHFVPGSASSPEPAQHAPPHKFSCGSPRKVYILVIFMLCWFHIMINPSKASGRAYTVKDVPNR